jgi:hypothetical protein
MSTVTGPLQLPVPVVRPYRADTPWILLYLDCADGQEGVPDSASPMARHVLIFSIR